MLFLKEMLVSDRVRFDCVVSAVHYGLGSIQCRIQILR